MRDLIFAWEVTRSVDEEPVEGWNPGYFEERPLRSGACHSREIINEKVQLCYYERYGG